MTSPYEYLVDKPETAAFICDGQKTKYLAPFIGADRTLAETAIKLKLSKSHMSYWLNQMLELGLIREERTEKRGRYQVPVYRAVAEAFIVPLEHISAESDEAILRLSMGNFEDRCLYSISRCGRTYADGWHLRFGIEDGKSWQRIIPKDGDTESARILNYWGRLELSPEQATAMRGELRKVLQNYLELSKNISASPEKVPHLFRLLLVEEFKNDS